MRFERREDDRAVGIGNDGVEMIEGDAAIRGVRRIDARAYARRVDRAVDDDADLRRARDRLRAREDKQLAQCRKIAASGDANAKLGRGEIEHAAGSGQRNARDPRVQVLEEQLVVDELNVAVYPGYRLREADEVQRCIGDHDVRAEVIVDRRIGLDT